MRGRPNLIIFAKTPRLGHVKSRLAADIGLAQATRAYRSMVAALLRRLATGPAMRRYIFVAAAKDGDLGNWHPGFERRRQCHGDLGARMADAFRQVPPGPTLLIGSDIPAIQSNHVRGALKRLKTANVVFGPAGDGGYWLVGFRHFRRTGCDFKNVRWSSVNALADSLACLPAHSKTALTDPLDDIDTGDDWRRWQQRRR